MPAEVSPPVRERLLAYAGGNPLALLEIAGSLTADELAGRRPLPDPLPLSPGLEKAFLEQVRRLSPHAQKLLLVAACAQDDSWDDVCAAARRARRAGQAGRAGAGAAHRHRGRSASASGIR